MKPNPPMMPRRMTILHMVGVVPNGRCMIRGGNSIVGDGLTGLTEAGWCFVVESVLL